jgi:hypothetical protein
LIFRKYSSVGDDSSDQQQKEVLTAGAVLGWPGDIFEPRENGNRAFKEINSLTSAQSSAKIFVVHSICEDSAG